MATTHGDLILTGGDPKQDRSLQRQAADGKLRRVGDGIYAVDNARSIEEIVCGGWAPILARYAPGAVLQGRTALHRTPWRERGADGRVVFPGWVFATDPVGRARRRLSLPGLEIRTFPGPGPLQGDMAFLGVRMPGEARALLENLQASRARNGPSRTIGREGVEREVERLLETAREEGLREIRQRAERIAGPLGAQEELPILLNIIGAVVGTRKVKLAAKDVAARRRKDFPYDPACMERLKRLATTLGRVSLPDLPDPHVAPDERACASFVEAYFTNFIEGTRFLVDKARRIVFAREEADGRPKDGRDVTQTFAQVSKIGPGEGRAPDADAFVAELRTRNAGLMDARSDIMPGTFKVDPNSAGDTVFVRPDLVEGTLREGFAMLADLGAPFSRGLFAHTLIVLVHPFNDGNGRTARIMMTKELVGGGQSRIVVPTIYRSDYVGGLRVLSSGSMDAAPLVRAMLRCQSVTARIASPDLDEAIRLWASTHAFLEDEKHARFTEPNPAAEIVWNEGIPAPKAYWAERLLDQELRDDTSNVLSLDRKAF